MKIRKIICSVLAVLLVLLGTATAFAADLDGDGYDDETGEYIGAVATEPVTEAPTEPPTEPATEAPTEPPTEPVTEAPTEPPTEAETEAQTPTEAEEKTQAVETPTQKVIQYAEPDYTIDQETPTVQKTVSQKTYSTSYTAGLVSWVCVIVGILAVAAVLISTTAGGRRHKSIEDCYIK